jgi:hypothetical protein
VIGAAAGSRTVVIRTPWLVWIQASRVPFTFSPSAFQTVRSKSTRVRDLCRPLLNWTRLGCEKLADEGGTPLAEASPQRWK